ncbi:hypothetical protein EDB92DRAFT_1829518 [Lactarius akahatsu]|uniref:Uncharacterized protein n=1 Tax=Lactarius akahatsu TaxID=416441 RepID=A0AAD4LUL0_9AGAM|nr:hypothetical protein EDB92DRAFT_1829518 [Lactarius akahatsu]
MNTLLYLPYVCRLCLLGQAYVALSRATSLDGLQVLNFDPSKVLVDAKVKRWSAGLETLGEPISVEDSDDPNSDEDIILL